MPLISLFSSVFKPIGNSFKNTGRDLIYSIIPNSDLTFTLIPENDLFYNFILDNDVRYVSIPDNNLIDTFIFNNDILYTMVPNNDGSYILIPSDDINRTVLKPPVVFYGLISIGEGSGVCNGGCPECPTFYVTGDGPTFCESNIFVADEFSSMSGYGYITYGGYVKTVDLNNTNFATYRDDCVLCDTPTPTPTSTDMPTPTPTSTPTPTPTSTLCSSPYQINLIDRTAEGSGPFGTNLSLARQSADGFNDGSLHPGAWGVTYFKNSAPQVGDYIYSNSNCTNAATDDGYYIISINGTYRVVEMVSWQIVLIVGYDGLTSQTAGDSAYQIKRDYPSSTDGLYWIKNGNISGGTPFQIYADMTTDGGGWTLLVTNQDTNGWTYENAILLNQSSPVISGSNYSIVAYANYLKKGGTTFQYMMEANTRGNWGGIWSVPQFYSFLNSDNSQTSITLDTKFGTWNYNNNSVEERMPWYSNGSGILTTSSDASGDWWGTIITNGGWNPAPWMDSDGMPAPGIIWYWVR